MSTPSRISTSVLSPIYLLAGGGSSHRAAYCDVLAEALTVTGTPTPSVAYIGAASGDTLGTAHGCTVKSEAMPEAFYFASKGVVLPAGQNGGLPVVTVNTPEVDVQFLRVNADALPAFLEQVGGRPDARRSDQQADGEADG